MTSSVYPEMNNTFISGRPVRSRSASNRPFIPGMMTSVTKMWMRPTKEVAAEAHPDVRIWLARQVNGRWEHAVEVANGLQADGTPYPTWNPVLFQAPKGPLFLFYKVGPSLQWRGMVATSDDDGRTWSTPRRLADGILGPSKDKPVLLPGGSWLSGSEQDWRVRCEISRDAGQSWQSIGPVEKGAGFEAIQPTILFPAAGKIEALCRTKQGVIAMTWSSDGGRTWTPLAATELPNPNSGIDGVTLNDGRLLLVYNHSAHLPNWSGHGYRYPLDVAISRDGLKWQHVFTLEDEPNPSGEATPATAFPRQANRSASMFGEPKAFPILQ